MKRRPNTFSKLSPEDRQFVHELCEKYTYAEAVELLGKPRPIGLSIETTVSTLCRFNTRYHPDAAETGATSQYCRAVSTRHQAEGYANTQAVLALAQNRLIAALRSGKAMADLTTEFRLFFQSHRAWLAENKWRATRTAAELKQSWEAFTDNVASSSEVDFTWTDIQDPVWDEMTRSEMQALEMEEYDQEIERAHGYPDRPKKPGIKEELMAMLAREYAQPLQPGMDDEESAASDSGNSTTFPSKSPGIAHFPPNFASPGNAKSPFSAQDPVEHEI